VCDIEYNTYVTYKHTYDPYGEDIRYKHTFIRCIKTFIQYMYTYDA